MTHIQPYSNLQTSLSLCLLVSVLNQSLLVPLFALPPLYNFIKRTSHLFHSFPLTSPLSVNFPRDPPVNKLSGMPETKARTPSAQRQVKYIQNYPHAPQTNEEIRSFE